MIKYTMQERRPNPVYVVDDGTKMGMVEKTGDTTRCKRWKLLLEGEEDKFFKSRREAFHFFETGEKYQTNPVFAVLGGRKGTKRIR